MLTVDSRLSYKRFVKDSTRRHVKLSSENATWRAVIGSIINNNRDDTDFSRPKLSASKRLSKESTVGKITTF